MSGTGEDATQVVIVGGGPVGHGLALSLGMRGVRSILVERYRTPSPIPKGQNLNQRTMEMFHFWGAEDALRAARTIPPEYGMGGLTAYGTLLGTYQHDWLQRELVRPFYHTGNERLPQYATEAVMRARAAEMPAIRALYGWTAETVEQDADGVRVTVAERDGPGRRVLRADYAAGCDGSRSTVRRAAGITETRTDHDRLMVLLVFRSTGLHELLKRYPGKSFFSVIHPDMEGYWRFFGRVDLGTTWFFHAPVPVGTTRDNTDFTALLQEAAGAEFDVEIEHVGFWDLRFAVGDTYRNGRLFIAGDAAHSHPPYGGYGINTGLEDSANLAWKLAAALQGWGGPGLLDSYSAERQPVFASTAADFIERSIRVDRDFLAAHDPARDRAAFEAAWAGRTSGARTEVASFEPNYEGSPIVCGPRGRPSAIGAHRHEARPGHHLSPQPAASGRSVYAAMGPGFTLLTTEPEGEVAEGFRQEAERRGVPFDILGIGEAAREAYDAEHVLVRPDQFVAWAGEEVDAGVVLARATGAD